MMDTFFKNKSAHKLLLVTASFAAVCSVSNPANAFTIGSLNPDSAPGIHANKAPYTVGITSADVGKTFSTYWILKGVTEQPLKAKAYFKVTELTSSNLSLDTVLFNRTDDSFEAAITSLGIGVGSKARNVSFNNSGLQAGDKDIFRIDIAGKYGKKPTVTLKTLPVEFQTSDGSSYKLLATKPREVPTPAATLGILAFGAVSAVSTLKRKSKSITE